MRKILAIDDNKDNLISLEAIINYSFSDVSFISALDGHTGIDLAESEDPDVILLDIVMPKMDGFEVCRRLKLDENTKNIPVVFLTSITGDKESRIKALKVGAEAFLTKPIDETELLAQISAMVKIKDANRKNINEKEHLAKLVAERTSELEKSNIAAQKLVEKLRSENESRKKSEKSLMESEQNLVRGQQIAHMGYWKLYPKTGEIIGSEELLKIFEIRSKELSLDSFAAIVHPEDRVFDLAHINKGIELGKSWDIEHRLLFEDGRIKWVHVIGNPSLDKNKKVDFISGIVQDITKQKLTDEKLRESEARYTRVIDGTNDGIWDWNVITNEDYLSPRWKELLGFTDNELNNEYDTFFSRVHPEDIPRVEAAIQDHLEREIPYNIEHRLRTKSGSYKWFNVRGKADRDENGKAIHMSGSISDITERKLVEEALSESEILYKNLYNNAPLPYHSLDEGGNFIAVNPTWLSTMGYTEDEVVGKYYGDFLHPDWKMHFDEKFPVFKSKGHVQTSFKIRHKKGHYLDINLTGSIGYFSDGSFKQTNCVFQDVTKQTLAEKELKRSKKKFELLIQNNPDFLMTQKVNGDLDYVSPQSEKILGFSVEEIKNLDLSKQIYSDDLDEAMNYLSRALKGEEILNFEYRFIKKNKKIVWLSHTASPIISDGKITEIQSTIRDITEIKASAAILSSTNAKHEAMIENIGDVIAILGADGQSKYQSSNVTKWFGWKPEELIRSGGWDKMHPEDVERMQKVFTEVLETANPVKAEYRFKCKDGDYKWIEVTANNRLNDPIINGILINYHDITPRKQGEDKLLKAKEKAEESERLKSAFLANMSHEIRTPMNGIMGFTDLLEEADTSQEERKRYTSIVRSSGERLLELMNNLIDFSKAEAGQMMVSKTNVDITEVFQRLEGIFQNERVQKKIDLTFHNESNQRLVYTDLNFFESVLINLIKNAIKFTDQGFIKVNCKNDSEGLSLYVQDTGKGIRQDNINSIFERFNQEDSSLTKKHDGAGLGLAISKSYIDLLGGKIWAESELGKGSTFYFTIPLLENN